MITEIVHKNAEPWMSFKIRFFKSFGKDKGKKTGERLNLWARLQD